MVWVAAMSGRHAAAKPDRATDGLASVVLAEMVILVVVILMGLTGV
jgi:hypothetical protein